MSVDVQINRVYDVGVGDVTKTIFHDIVINIYSYYENRQQGLYIITQIF